MQIEQGFPSYLCQIFVDFDDFSKKSRASKEGITKLQEKVKYAKFWQNMKKPCSTWP